MTIYSEVKNDTLTDFCALRQNSYLQQKQLISHTPNHIDCPICERQRMHMRYEIDPGMTFAEASAVWLSNLTLTAPNGIKVHGFIRKNTERDYHQYVASLNLFFASIPLNKIHAGHMREYQTARLSGVVPFIRKRRPHDKIAGPCPASPKKCNQELGLLQRVLTRAHCWTNELEEYYRPLRVEKNDVPRALSPQEQELWLRTAFSREAWHLVYWYSLLSFGTAMSTNEIRGLRLGDVSLYHRTVNIGALSAKCRGRQRTIPLVSADELFAVEKLLERARQCGAVDPQHYLFPFRVKKEWYPDRPMTVSGIKKKWREVQQQTGLHWFRQYDTRHTAATRMAEAGIDVVYIKRRMGHLTQEMSEHYTHISMAAERLALERRPPQSQTCATHMQRSNMY